MATKLQNKVDFRDYGYIKLYHKNCNLCDVQGRRSGCADERTLQVFQEVYKWPRHPYRWRSVALSIGGVVVASATSFATWQETYLTTPGGPALEDEFSTGEPNRPPERL